jgi:hypothetical protein
MYPCRLHGFVRCRSQPAGISPSLTYVLLTERITRSSKRLGIIPPARVAHPRTMSDDNLLVRRFQ